MFVCPLTWCIYHICHKLLLCILSLFLFSISELTQELVCACLSGPQGLPMLHFSTDYEAFVTFQYGRVEQIRKEERRRTLEEMKRDHIHARPLQPTLHSWDLCVHAMCLWINLSFIRSEKHFYDVCRYWRQVAKLLLKFQHKLHIHVETKHKDNPGSFLVGTGCGDLWPTINIVCVCVCVLTIFGLMWNLFARSHSHIPASMFLVKQIHWKKMFSF